MMAEHCIFYLGFGKNLGLTWIGGFRVLENQRDTKTWCFLSKSIITRLVSRLWSIWIMIVPFGGGIGSWVHFLEMEAWNLQDPSYFQLLSFWFKLCIEALAFGCPFIAFNAWFLIILLGTSKLYFGCPPRCVEARCWSFNFSGPLVGC